MRGAIRGMRTNRHGEWAAVWRRRRWQEGQGSPHQTLLHAPVNHNLSNDSAECVSHCDRLVRAVEPRLMRGLLHRRTPATSRTRRQRRAKAWPEWRRGGTVADSTSSRTFVFSVLSATDGSCLWRAFFFHVKRTFFFHVKTSSIYIKNLFVK